MDQNNSEGNQKFKKKKFRFYDSYIPKILKQSFDNNGITSDARQQLNSILIIFSKHISNISHELTLIAKKKTISEKEIKSAIMIYLTGELQIHAINEGEQAIEEFTKNVKHKGSSRQTKAGIIFPPSVVEKFLRKFDTTLFMITQGAPVFLAAVLEYICLEIIESAALLAKDDKRIRITVSDLESSIKNDVELSKLIINNNIKFLGGAVEQYIHPNLITKKSGKQVKRVIKTSDNNEKIIKYKAGSIAIKDIKKYQKMGNTLIFAKQPFEKFVRQIVYEYKPNIKISKVVFSIIQYVIEDYLVNFLASSNAAAIHAGRVKLMASDIEFIHNQKNNKKFNLHENNKISYFLENIDKNMEKNYNFDNVQNDSVESDDLDSVDQNSNESDHEISKQDVDEQNTTEQNTTEQNTTEQNNGENDQIKNLNDNELNEKSENMKINNIVAENFLNSDKIPDIDELEEEIVTKPLKFAGTLANVPENDLVA